MFAASSAAGATLQPVARILLIICSVQITVTNCLNADFDGPFVDKHFLNSQCPVTGTVTFTSEVECLDKCRGNSACTAIIYYASTRYCKLLRCKLPVPPPAGDDPGWTAYSLKPEPPKPADFDGPYVGKYYPGDQCPYIYHVSGISVEECLDKCLSHRGPRACTAVNSGKLCVLRACKMPVPLPAGKSRNSNAYSLKPAPNKCGESQKCSKVNGDCIEKKKWKDCDGKLKKKWCDGKKCGCCYQ